jgi:hypothetical protein
MTIIISTEDLPLFSSVLRADYGTVPHPNPRPRYDISDNDNFIM